MARQHIRTLKRNISKGTRPDAGGSEEILARESDLALLERSISFGHARLAVIRLAIAVSVGAEIPAAHWAYCEEAYRRSNDPNLLKMMGQAGQRAARAAVTDARPASAS